MKGEIERGRTEGVWYLRVPVQGAPSAAGRRPRRRETFHGTKRDAERRLRELLAESERGTLGAGRLTVGDYATAWLASKRGTIEDRSLEDLERHVRLYVVPNLGTIKLEALRPSHVRTAVAAWRQAPRNEKIRASKDAARATEALSASSARPRSEKKAETSSSSALSARPLSASEAKVSATTVRSALATLRAICARAVLDGLLSRNPAASELVDAPKTEHREMKTLDRDGLMRLLRAAEGTDLQTPIALLVTTGLRRGEAFGLRWSDVDLDARRLTVRRSLEKVGDELRYKAPKTKRSSRTIVMAASLVDLLRAHRLAQRKQQFELGLSNIDDSPVFADAFGRPLDLKAFSKRFARLTERAGIRIRLHDLRHTYGTLALESGVNLKTVSSSMGHSTIAVTANIYLHASESLESEAAARIDAAIGTSVAEAIANAAISTATAPLLPHKATTTSENARGCNASMVAGTGFEPVTFGL